MANGLKKDKIYLCGEVFKMHAIFHYTFFHEFFEDSYYFCLFCNM